MVVLAISSVFAVNEPLSSTVGNTGDDKIEKVYTISQSVWNTAKAVIQVAAFSGIIIAGISYMFSSADAKAEMKKSLGYLILGLVLVFGASIVVDVIYTITSEAL